MTEAILLLRIEHHQADNLLSSIEDQIDLDGDVDLELMQSIAEYFSGYPDECHHPVEDLVFRKMNSRDPKRAAAVAEILSEHKGSSTGGKRRQWRDEGA